MPRNIIAPLVLATILAFVLAQPAMGLSEGSISGRLVLLENGEAVSDPDEFGQAVAYFEPSADVPVEAAPEPLIMTTRRRQFEPRVLVVTVGSEVIFPNEDPILHNVFSSSANNPFDLGLYARSEGKTHRFEQPGLVRVFCNVHPAMSAHIVVLDTPHFAIPDSDGNFRLDHLPPGPGRLTVWHERAEPRQIELDIGDRLVDTGTAELPLTVRQLRQQRERIRRPARRGRY